MNYLITGATSMIGCQLANTISKTNIVYLVIRKGTKNIERIVINKNTKIIYASMDEYENINLKINDCIDVAIHFAWDGVRGDARNDKDLQMANYTNTINLFKGLAKLQLKKFIGIGSQAEYGNIDYYTEKATCVPDTFYGIYKLKACQDIQHLASVHGIKFLWLRIFSVYGKYDYKNSLIMMLINKFKSNTPVDLTSCEQIWNYTYVKDVIEAILYLNSGNYDGIFNITTVNNIKLKVYVELLKKILNSNATINYGVVKSNSNCMISSNEKLLRTGFKFKYDFATGISDMLNN